MKMTNQNWKWWVGINDERFHTECDTRDQAVEIALEEYDDGAWIIEAVKADNVQLSAYFDTDRFLEDAEESAYDLNDPEGSTTFFDVTPDQGNDLEVMVRAAIDVWQAKHSLKFAPWAFAASRNLEYIRADDTEVSET
jgi:hypothetical protein